ncbi:MAG: N-acetylmuramoyl-L-alanine amidase [Anaerobutyricum sp.]|mgnify:FL=1
MKLVQSIMTKNPCYTAGRKITVKGLMLHSVGCPQPNASVFIKNWNTPSYGTACVHGFIDGNDGTVYQTLPWNHRGWHCASGPKGSGNNTHIGVEMCEPVSIRYTGGSSFTCLNLSAARTSVKKTYEAAVELFAYLCKLYGLNPTADGVIISHREGHSRGIASNHGDPEHLWNGLGMGYTMNTFRKDVKEKMQGGTVKPDETKEMYRVRKSWGDAVSQKGAFHELENAKKCADANKGYAVFNTSGKQVYPKTDFSPYLVEVTATDLNIRKGPGTNYGKTGKFTGKGVFTITEERAGTGSNKGWGKLKSGAGWISLDYVKRL